MFVYVAITIAIIVTTSAFFIVPRVANKPMNGELKCLKRMEKQLQRHHDILNKYL